MDIGDLEDILRHNEDVIVIVDEAYIDFGGQTALGLLPRYENLVVVQTFSKSRSMAGMRIGYAMGHRDLIKAMNDVKYSFNSYTMNQTSLVLGVEAVKDEAYFHECINKILKTREWVSKELKEIGFDFPESSANFIFATHKTMPAESIFKALREREIYVRHFNLPRIKNYLRITIGTDWEMEQLVNALKRYCMVEKDRQRKQFHTTVSVRNLVEFILRSGDITQGTGTLKDADAMLAGKQPPPKAPERSWQQLFGGGSFEVACND